MATVSFFIYLFFFRKCCNPVLISTFNVRTTFYQPVSIVWLFVLSQCHEYYKGRSLTFSQGRRNFMGLQWYVRSHFNWQRNGRNFFCFRNILSLHANTCIHFLLYQDALDYASRSWKIFSFYGLYISFCILYIHTCRVQSQ